MRNFEQKDTKDRKRATGREFLRALRLLRFKFRGGFGKTKEIEKPACGKREIANNHGPPPRGFPPGYAGVAQG